MIGDDLWTVEEDFQTEGPTIFGAIGGLFGGGGEKSRVEKHETMSEEQKQIYNAVLTLLAQSTNFGRTSFEQSSLSGLEQLVNNINTGRAANMTGQPMPSRGGSSPKPEAATVVELLKNLGEPLQVRQSLIPKRQATGARQRSSDINPTLPFSGGGR